MVAVDVEIHEHELLCMKLPDCVSALVRTSFKSYYSSPVHKLFKINICYVSF